MSNSLRVGVIGCGQIAKLLHVPDLATSKYGEVVALCDLLKNKAQDLAKSWAPDAAIYRDYKKMLKEAKLDAVVVALPNVLHAPVTIAALKAGCHVMVEKPMAASSREAQHMIDTAKRKGKLLMVNQSQRNDPVHLKAKEVLDSGMMGKILLINTIFGHSGPEAWSPTGKWFMRKKDARFGAMADLGVHKADLVRYLSGKEVAEVSAYFGTLEKKRCDVDDNLVTCMVFTDGTLGTLTASWTAKGTEVNHTLFYCEKGTLRVKELPGRPLVAHLTNPACEVDFEIPPGIHRYEGSWGMDSGGRFLKAVLGLADPFCSGEEGKKSLDVIFAAEKSALTGRSIKV